MIYLRQGNKGEMFALQSKVTEQADQIEQLSIQVEEKFSARDSHISTLEEKVSTLAAKIDALQSQPTDPSTDDMAQLRRLLSSKDEQIALLEKELEKYRQKST